MQKTLFASSVTLALGAPAAHAALVTDVLGPYDWFTDSANFTMLSPNGGVVGLTNDVNLAWDGNAYNASSDYTGPGGVSNVTLSSTTSFFAHNWTAHDVQMFLPGTYSFDVTLGGGNPETGTLNATVATGQLGLHLLFDWSGDFNIDMFVVFDWNSVFGSGLLYSTTTTPTGMKTCDANFTGAITQNCLYDGGGTGSAGAPTKDQVWMLASTDADGDGIMGVPMAPNGPLGGFSANFSATLAYTPDPIPIPPALWLFGSGLLGLAGIARRKTRS